MKKKHIIISKIENDTQNLEVLGDISTINKLESSFRVLVKEGIQFSPAVKERRWDGKISFFKNNTIPLGLLSELLNICYDKFKKWVETLNIPFEPRNYQYKIAYDLINKKRVSAQSETSSGKCIKGVELELEVSDEIYEKYFKGY